MTVDRIPLDGDRATAFDVAHDKRRSYIHAELIYLLAGGEESVPYPGCPQCGAPAECFSWSTYNDGPGGVLHIDVDSCGHRFRTAPVPERFWQVW